MKSRIFSIPDLLTYDFIYLLITETIKQGGKKSLEGGKKGRGDGPERKVGDIRL